MPQMYTGRLKLEYDYRCENCSELHTAQSRYILLTITEKSLQIANEKIEQARTKLANDLAHRNIRKLSEIHGQFITLADDTRVSVTLCMPPRGWLDYFLESPTLPTHPQHWESEVCPKCGTIQAWSESSLPAPITIIGSAAFSAIVPLALFVGMRYFMGDSVGQDSLIVMYAIAGLFFILVLMAEIINPRRLKNRIEKAQANNLGLQHVTLEGALVVDTAAKTIQYMRNVHLQHLKKNIKLMTNRNTDSKN